MNERTIALIGEENLNKIKKAKVLVLGLGGVGGYAVEVLIRSGIENITIADYDYITESNLNRQIIALNENIGSLKTEAIKQRITSINTNVKVTTISEKINKENVNILLKDANYIIDACDTIEVKKQLIKLCHEKNINLITVCGMGKKLNPKLVEICDLKDTSYDPIAKIIRKYVKDEKIKGKVPVVFSREKPINNDKVISSMMMVPSTAGIYAAYYVIDKIINS